MEKLSQKFKPYTGLALRLGLGVIFTYHGYHKIFGEGAGFGASWNPYGMPAVMQILVSWGELIGGVAFLIGFLTSWASLGIIIIMGGAIAMVHGKNGFSLMNEGYEYNFALIVMCVALILSGPGPFSITKENLES